MVLSKEIKRKIRKESDENEMQEEQGKTIELDENEDKEQNPSGTEINGVADKEFKDGMKNHISEEENTNVVAEDKLEKGGEKRNRKKKEKTQKERQSDGKKAKSEEKKEQMEDRMNTVEQIEEDIMKEKEIKMENIEKHEKEDVLNINQSSNTIPGIYGKNKEEKEQNVNVENLVKEEDKQAKEDGILLLNELKEDHHLHCGDDVGQNEILERKETREKEEQNNLLQTTGSSGGTSEQEVSKNEESKADGDGGDADGGFECKEEAVAVADVCK